MLFKLLILLYLVSINNIKNLFKQNNIDRMPCKHLIFSSWNRYEDMIDLFPGTRIYEDFKHRSGHTDDIWLKRIEDIPEFQDFKESVRFAALCHQVLGDANKAADLLNRYEKM